MHTYKSLMPLLINKQKIYEQFGYFAVKSRNTALYDSPQRVPLKYLIKKLHEGILRNYKSKTGVQKAMTPNLSTDVHGNWFESKKLIEYWVIELNKEYKEDLFHWIGEK